MVNRLLTAIITGIVTALIVWILGYALTLMPAMAPLGAVLESLSPVFGILVGIWSYVTGRVGL